MIELKDLTIRAAETSDTIPISNLLIAHGLVIPGETDEDKRDLHWRRWWDTNPYYKNSPHPITYGWVMIFEGRIVGFFGCIPRIYFRNQAMVPLAVGSAWAVEKDFRPFIHLLSDQFFINNPIKIKLGTTTSKPVARYFEKYGGRAVSNPDLQEVYMIPIRLKRLAMFKAAGLTGKYPAMKPFLSLALSLIPWSWQHQMIPADPHFQETALNQLDARFETFWQKCLSANRGFLTSRSLETMKWYYGGKPSPWSKQLFLYTAATGEILGYASMMKQAVKDNDQLIRYTVVDLLALDKTSEKKILKGLIRYAAHHQFDVLEVPLPGKIKRKNIPALTFVRKVAFFPVFYQNADPEDETYYQDPVNWQITPFDGDTCLG